MADIQTLLASNQAWAADMVADDPRFFERLALQQSPAYLWIGCSDSRVPANQLVGLPPGEMFVQRNIANLVVHSDLNCLSVLQYAVDVLQVQHVIVCGHYGCGGIQAALLNLKLGLLDNWLRHVQDVQHKHQALLSSAPTEAERIDRLCELNVIEQVLNVSQTTIVQSGWERGQQLAIHAWIYGIQDGLLHDLNMSVTHADQLSAQYNQAIARLGSLVSR